MNEEVLDDKFQKLPKRYNPSILNWASIIILWIGIGFCFSEGLIGEVKVLIATTLLVLATIVTFLNYKLGVRLTIMVILLGTISLIEFFPTKYFISFGINTIDLGFEISLFGVGLIHYFTNREELYKSLKNFVNPEISEEELKATKRSKVNGFKRRFSNKRVEELEMIANNEQLVPDAIKAARELLDEKN